MLSPIPFALAFALSSVIFYAFLYLLKLFAPPFFKLLLNSQLLGAPIASQVPDLNFANLVGILIAVAVVASILGYLVAIFYNKFNQKK